MDATFLYQVAAHIGNKCDFNTRQNLFFTSKCFRDVHAFRKSHTWTVNTPCNLRIKMQMLKKFKTSLDTLKITIQSCAGVEGVSDIIRENQDIAFSLAIAVNEIDPIPSIDDAGKTKILLGCTTPGALQNILSWLDAHPTVKLEGLNIENANPEYKCNMLYAIVPHVSRITALQIGSSYLNPRPSDECIAQLGKIERVQVSNIYPTLNMAYDNHPIHEATCVIDSSMCLSVNRFVDLMEFYKRRCLRLNVLVFEELHATQLIMYDLVAGLGVLGKICHAVRVDNDGVIAFSKLSLSDPALIALIRELSIYSTEKSSAFHSRFTSKKKYHTVRH